MTPVQAIHFRAGCNDPCGSLPTKYFVVLWPFFNSHSSHNLEASASISFNPQCIGWLVPAHNSAMSQYRSSLLSPLSRNCRVQATGQLLILAQFQCWPYPTGMDQQSRADIRPRLTQPSGAGIFSISNQPYKVLSMLEIQLFSWHCISRLILGGTQKTIPGVMPITSKITTYSIYFVYIFLFFLIVKTIVTDIHVHYSLYLLPILKKDPTFHTKNLYSNDKPATLLS